MLTLDQLRTAKPEDITSELAYAVESLLHVAQLALECDHGGTTTTHREGAVADTLALARVLIGLTVCGAEKLERETSRGIYAPKPEGAA